MTSALNQFLYSAVSGLPDYVDLNNESLKVLNDTYQMLTEQIEHDATPEFLNELKSKICAGYIKEPHPKAKNLAEIFQDKGLNPFNFPFEYLLNGALPQEPITEESDDDPLAKVESANKDLSAALDIKTSSKSSPEKAREKKRAAEESK